MNMQLIFITLHRGFFSLLESFVLWKLFYFFEFSALQCVSLALQSSATIQFAVFAFWRIFNRQCWFERISPYDHLLIPFFLYLSLLLPNRFNFLNWGIQVIMVTLAIFWFFEAKQYQKFKGIPLNHN